MNLFAYIRVSGLGQVDKDGPIRQRAAIAACAARHGLRIAGEYFERGVSGTVESMERPEFAEMVTKILLLRKLALPGIATVDGILVECVDRMARDVLVSEMLLRTCRENNIKVFSAVDDQLINIAVDADKNRTLLRQILSVIAQWDKTNTVQKLRAARIRMRAEGKRCEGSKPYGFKPGEAEILAHMRKLQKEGNSFAKIALYANMEGFRNRSGRPWKKSQVHAVLTSRDYAANKKAKKDYARSIHAISSVEGITSGTEVGGCSGTGACSAQGSSGVAPGSNS